MELVSNIEADHYYVRDENGLRYAVAVAASESEKREAQVAALRRELEGVEHQLAHLDDEPAPWVVDPPSPASVERQRVSLEGTKVVIQSELKRLAMGESRRSSSTTRPRTR